MSIAPKMKNTPSGYNVEAIIDGTVKDWMSKNPKIPSTINPLAESTVVSWEYIQIKGPWDV